MQTVNGFRLERSPRASSSGCIQNVIDTAIGAVLLSLCSLELFPNMPVVGLDHPNLIGQLHPSIYEPI